MKALLPVCRVPNVQGGGERGPAWVAFFVNDVISMDVKWNEDGARWKALTASLADAQFPVMEERREGMNR